MGCAPPFGGPPMMAPPGPMTAFPGFPAQSPMPTFQGDPHWSPMTGQQMPPPMPPSAPMANAGPAPVPTMPPGHRPAVLADLAIGKQQAAQPRIRMQAPEDLPPVQTRPLALPAPEALGVNLSATAPAAEVRVDWNATRARLERMGALSFRLDKLSGGDFRVIFLLRTNEAQRFHQIETTAATEAAAVQVAFEQADQWLGQR